MERLKKMHRWRSGGLHSWNRCFCTWNWWHTLPETKSEFAPEKKSREKGGLPVGGAWFLGAEWLSVLRSVHLWIEKPSRSSTGRQSKVQDQILPLPCFFLKGRCLLNFRGRSLQDISYISHDGSMNGIFNQGKYTIHYTWILWVLYPTPTPNKQLKAGQDKKLVKYSFPSPMIF